MSKGPFFQPRQRTDPPYVPAGSADLPRVQKSPSNVTGRSSFSEGYQSGHNGRRNHSVSNSISDRSVEQRIRQLSTSTIGLDSTPGWPSSDTTTFQPLEIPKSRDKHECPDEVRGAFLESFEDVKGEILDESWIRIATWWLLKVRASSPAR